MRITAALLLPVVVITMAGMGLGAEDAESRPARGPLAARVNGVPIYQVDLDEAYNRFIRDAGVDQSLSEEDRAEARQQVLDGLIGTELLHQKARSIPVSVPRAEVEKALSQAREGMGADTLAGQMARRGMTDEDIEEQIEKNLTVQRFISETILSTVQVEESEIRRFYDEHPDEMIRPEGVEARHLFVKAPPGEDGRREARKRIDEALARIKAGEDFGDIARRYSDDASATIGGDLGLIHRGQIAIPEIDESVFTLPPGTVSDVIESPAGWHLIMVMRKVGPSIPDFDEAKESIREFLKQQKSQEAIQRMVDSLRAASKIEIL